MKKYVLILLILILPVVPMVASLQTQYFLSSPDTNYYPGTKATITLLNLEFNQTYSLLIGANQHTWDQQWINFTATRISMTLPFIHTAGHCLFDSSNQTLTRLQLSLFDASHNLLGSYWLNVENYVSNANLQGWSSLGVQIIIFLFSGFIFAYVIVKYIIVKLL